MRNICYLMVFVSLLSGCIATRHYIDPNYQGKYGTDFSLAFAPIPPVSVTHYAGNLNMEFGKGNPSVLVANYLKKSIPSIMKNYTRFSSVTTIDTAMEFDTVKVSAPYIKDDTIAFKVPRTIAQPQSVLAVKTSPVISQPISVVVKPVNDTIVQPDTTKKSKDTLAVKVKDSVTAIVRDSSVKTTDSTVAKPSPKPEIATVQEPRSVNVSKDPDLIVVFDNASVSTVGGGTSRVLSFKSKYVLWDNVNKKIYACGIIDAFADGLYGEITKDTWNTLMRNISSELMTGIRKLRAKRT